MCSDSQCVLETSVLHCSACTGGSCAFGVIVFYPAIDGQQILHSDLKTCNS